MIDVMKLKYKVNYNPAIYNFTTYESKEATYLTYEQARANQWKCEKCKGLFASLRELKLHKIEYHSY
jgi:hypothetical protein